jgi:hypothetical protein
MPRQSHNPKLYWDTNEHSAGTPQPKKKDEPQSTQKSQSYMKKFFKIWIKTKI